MSARRAAQEDLVHRFVRKTWLATLLLCVVSACAGRAKPPAAPEVKEPPHDPLAWLPEDASVAGELTLAPFRGTPLWAVWEEAQQQRAVEAELIDASKIERALFAGGAAAEGEPASFVAALSGGFGAKSLEARAAARGLVPESHGLLTFYRAGGAAFAQVYPELIVACSPDRIEALATRAALGGEQAKLRDSPLFRALAARLKWSDADLVLIGEDPHGELKGRAEQDARRFGFAFSAQDVVRAGVALELGARPSILALVETGGEAQAEALRAAVDSALSALGDNLFVGLLGLRPLIKALATTRDAGYLALGGSFSADDLNRALDRLAAMLSVSLAKSAPAAPAP